MPRFSPGDRVIIQRHFQEPVGGTVISVTLTATSEYRAFTQVMMLYVIFDDGSEITAEAGNFWHETEYNPHIPF